MADNIADYYMGVLADLERRRSELDSAIAVLLRVAAEAGVDMPPPTSGGSAPTAPSGGGGGGGRPTQMRDDAFFGMKAPQAIKTYLGIAKQPQTVPQIVDALKRGGYLSKSLDLYNSVYTTLGRLDEKGEAVKLPDGRWGLTEWYPASAKRKRAGGDQGEDSKGGESAA